MRKRMISLACLSGCLLAGPAHAQDAPVAPRPPMVGRGIYLVKEFRNPTLAAALSLAIPGGGQVYNDDIGKFLGAAAGIAGGGLLLYYNQEPMIRIVAGAGAGLVWLWSVSDAYLAATVYNQLLEQHAYGNP
ncbi:MAG: hypothetical protein FJZ01_24340 [Candidatus Sericytochromatia bacterium]|nr:hypothetical protein [Candidatus Tanganyikabacteria bacterium]